MGLDVDEFYNEIYEFTNIGNGSSNKLQKSSNMFNNHSNKID